MRGRSLPLPGQYESPRPDNWRGAASPRLPSFSLCIHSISPVAASSATTARRVPAVEYTTPSTINGVPSKLNSGRGPSASVLKRHATSSLLKLSLLIWSSGEYLVLARSPPHVRHSRAGVPAWPDSRPFVAANTTRRIARDEPSSGIRRGVIKPRSHAFEDGSGENAGHDAPGSPTGQVPRPRNRKSRRRTQNGWY